MNSFHVIQLVFLRSTKMFGITPIQDELTGKKLKMPITWDESSIFPQSACQFPPTFGRLHKPNPLRADDLC